MPYAKRCNTSTPNRAYAHVSETKFGQAAQTLTDKLISMGFDDEETRQAIEPAQGSFDNSGLFGSGQRVPASFKHTNAASAEALALLENTPGLVIRQTGMR